MKVFAALVLGLWAIVPCARAEDARPAPQGAAYLEELQTKLDHIARRANQPSSSGSSVAGLRGSKQGPVSKQLYWKGKETQAPVSIEEVKMFRMAVEEARAGKTAQASATLKAFLEKYPQSSLKPDVEETLKVIQPEPPKIS